MKLQDLFESEQNVELLKKLHKSRNLPTKQLMQVVQSFGWKAEMERIFIQQRHVRHSNKLSSILGLPDHSMLLCIDPVDDNKDPITYEVSFKNLEAAEQVLELFKKFEVSKLPNQPEKKQELAVVNLTEIKELKNNYYSHSFKLEIYFVVKALVLESDKGTKTNINDDNQYRFTQTEFHKELMNKVNEVLGLEDYETEQKKKREAARIASAKGEIGHCPICGKLQKIKKAGNGYKMVHHGYQRPGHGYIVGDCFGVGHSPYELSNEGNVAYKPALERYLKQQESQLEQLESGKVTSLKQGKETVSVGDRGWDAALKGAIASTKNYIRYINEDIKTNDQKIEKWEERPLPKTGKIEE